MSSQSNFKIPSTDPRSYELGFAGLIDYNLHNNASSNYAVLVPANDSKPAVVSITWREFGHAVHRGAHIINPVHKPIGTGKVLGIFAVTDSLLYYALVGAIMRSGNIPFPISNRNSSAAILNLIEKTSCHHIIYSGSSALERVAQEVRQEVNARSYELNIIPMPALAQLFVNLGNDNAASDESFTEYPKFPGPVMNDVAMILHSSGSTGLPKPITLTQRYWFDTMMLPGTRGTATPAIHGATALPAFHLMGLISAFLIPLILDVTVALWMPSNPPPVATPETTLRAFQVSGCTSCLVVPSFLVAWSRDEAAIKFLATMELVMTGGGPLPIAIGDELVRRGVPLRSAIGGTEFSMLTTLDKKDPTLWAWLHFTDRMRIRWVPQAGYEHGACEMQILDGEHFKPMVHNIETPDGPGYATSDLYIPHPTEKDLWRIIGRLDDQIILATGEKVNPGPIQDIIARDSRVNGALLFGRARNQIGVLIEPLQEFDSTDATKLAAFRNDIWPSVEMANRSSATFARIFKEMILPTSPGKQLPRTPKGTLIHKQALQKYEYEIEAVYAAADKAKGDDVPLPADWSEAHLVPWLKQRVEEIMEHSVNERKDIFEQGADSLTATYIRNRIHSAMYRSQDTLVKEGSQNISQNIVFNNPTIVSLAKHIAVLALSPKASTANSTQEALDAMEELVDRYTLSLPSKPRLPHETVLLTGSTGALGSLLLAKLLADDRVERIWAVNRPSSARGPYSIAHRQHESFLDQNLDVDPLFRYNGTKLIFVEADLDADFLGLDKHLYHEICSSTTLIIHNSWRLDFNLSIASFESHIKGTRSLIDIALASPLHRYTRVFFTSSIATVASWSDTSVLVPEEPIADARISVGNGYGEGKYVSEKLLEHAHLQSGVPTTNFRIGQLSGSQNGAWAISDWVPIIVASSIAIGYLPDAIGSVSWLPLDNAAQAIVDVGLDRTKPLDQTLHLFHPRPTSWTKIFNAISKSLGPLNVSDTGETQLLPLIPFSKWLAKLEAVPADDFVRVPGLKLLPFYRGMAHGDAAARTALNTRAHEEQLPSTFGEAVYTVEALGQPRLMTEKIQKASRTMKDVQAVDDDDVNTWVQYWKSKGLFGNL